MGGEAFFFIGALLGLALGFVLGRIPPGPAGHLPPGGNPPRIGMVPDPARLPGGTGAVLPPCLRRRH